MSISLRRFITSKLNELNLKTTLQLCQNNDKFFLKLPFNSYNSTKSQLAALQEVKHEDVETISVETDVNISLNQSAIYKLFKDPVNVKICKNPGKFILEYSSPNIAKPFHVGHLRSTIIGSYLSKLLTIVNNEVIQMNYLGDYGTQFGFLKAGIDMENLSLDDIKADPLMKLLKVYVAANTSEDPGIADKARKIFEKMEFSEDSETIKEWEIIRNYTLGELNSMYERLNVVYDVYEFESMYRRRAIEDVITLLQDKNILHKESDGKTVVEVGNRRVAFIKSDETTLYLTRDIAAFLSRKEKYQMDKVLYVVDNGQNDHFMAIKSVINQLGLDADKYIQHVKFGRISGMSTRKGNVVFLKDILDEAKDLMFKKQQESPTTKVDLQACGESVADVLGVSAVIINDLKQKRLHNYTFDWNKILQLNGDTGIKLQYTHCRLYNLQQNNIDVKEADELNLEFLREPEALKLVFQILKYPEVINRSYESLESCYMVKHTFDLCNSASRAFKTLSVKNCSCDTTASQRLLLFNTARKVLKHSLEIFGLKVLNEM